MIQAKTKEEKEVTFTKTVDDKIELIKSISEVQSKIRDVVSSDFVLCKLSPQEKEYIIEMSNNAFLSRRILNNIKNKAKIWEWNKDKKEYYQRRLNQKELELMEEYKQSCFDSYMNRIYMIAITSRNVPKNYIIEKMTGIKDEPEEEETKLQNIMSQVKEKLGNSNEE